MAGENALLRSDAAAGDDLLQAVGDDSDGLPVHNEVDLQAVMLMAVSFDPLLMLMTAACSMTSSADELQAMLLLLTLLSPQKTVVTMSIQPQADRSVTLPPSFRPCSNRSSRGGLDLIKKLEG